MNAEPTPAIVKTVVKTNTSTAANIGVAILSHREGRAAALLSISQPQNRGCKASVRLKQLSVCP